MATFPHLFEVGRIGTLELGNRVMKAPQSTGLSHRDGTVSQRLVNHYRRLAEGGTALIIVEYAYVDELASKSAHCQLGISSNDHIPGLAWLADVIREAGSHPAIQIEHCGRQKFLGTPPIKSASAIPWPALFSRVGYEAVPEPMTIREILDVVEAFGQAALRAVLAGYELIEIHGAHGYLITNFLSPHTNKRTDLFGGSLENRMRLLMEIVRNIRAKIGRDFPLTVRLSGTDYEPDGFPIEETIEVCKVLEAEGIDAIHVSGGDHHQMIHQVSPMAVPRGHNVWAAEAIHKHVQVPVIASGSITTPALAESILATDKADYVALGRPLWADPDWTRKAEQGRAESIRPCIRCNEGCLERTFFRFRSITCGVNPETGREGELTIKPAGRRKRVAVIGAGPAGMEAARVCSLRGHDVALFEMRELGGALHEAGAPPFKEDLRFLLASLRHEVMQLGVRLVRERATAAQLVQQGFDTVILATGASPLRPNIPGIDQPHVVQAVDVLAKDVGIGNRVVVVGGGLVGVEVALHLSDEGRDVTVVEMLDAVMLDCAITDRIVYGEKLGAMNVKMLVGRRVTKVTNDQVVVTDSSGQEQTIEADNVVLAVGFEPRRELAHDLSGQSDVEVHETGDCVRPGKLFDAFHTAYRVGCKV